MAKHRYLLHPSSHGRPKKNQFTNSESVVKFGMISNSTEIDDFSSLPLEQN
ncbi:3186_t:CDS:1, partial [Gigaspora rosea]